MPPMNPLKIYDYLTKARTRVFEWARPLTPEQYEQKFPIGLGTLGRTLTHIMICEWSYMERVRGNAVPPYEEWPIQDETPPAFSVLEKEWAAQAERTRATLEGVRDWETPLEYPVTWDDKPLIVTASRSDIFTQLAFHEIHHRAQAMNMLRHLGVQGEDIDFNALMYARRPAST